MKIDAYSYTSAGGRGYNEDSVGAQALGNTSLYVVADGLGGHLHGEMASSCAVKSILDSLGQEAEPLDLLQNALAKANQNITELQQQNRSNMKSTAVCLLIRENQAFWAHVGDSRLYYFHNGEVFHYTADHSVAYKKFQSREIQRWQIPTDEDQSCLLRALGNPTRNQAEFSQTSEPLEAGDGFLLCSDGLWEYLRDHEILIDMLKTNTAQQWAHQLLLRVMERIDEGNDNLSLITVRIL